MTGSSLKRLHPQAYDALAEALTSFQWYKSEFSRMLTSLFAAERGVLAGISTTQSTKREVARAVVQELQNNEARYQTVTLGVLVTLSDYDPKFTHLARLDDGPTKVAAAQAALREVQRVVGQYKAMINDQEARAAADAAARADAAQKWAHTKDLDALKGDFYTLTAMANPNQRGLALEPFLNSLFQLFDLDPRAAFALKGEQIDGAFTFDTDDYLLEARWRKEQVDPDQVRSFSSKVAEKAHRTSGLMLSMNGFTAESVNLLKRSGSRLLLMDGPDLASVLEGALRLDELLLRKRRHSAETGDPYMAARDML